MPLVRSLAMAAAAAPRRLSMVAIIAVGGDVFRSHFTALSPGDPVKPLP